MPEVILDIADDIIVSASEERFKHGSIEGYIDHVKSLMGYRLPTGMRKFRQIYAPVAAARSFDYGSAYMFLPVYHQAERDNLGIDWTKVDTRMFLKDLADHTVQGRDASVIDREWSSAKLKAFGKAMDAYIIVGTEQMVRSSTPNALTDFSSGLVYMAHITTSQIELARLNQAFS